MKARPTLRPKGVGIDLPPSEYPPDIWTGAVNVEMSDGFAKRARGFGGVFGSTLFAPKWLENTRQADVAIWAYGGDTQLAQTDGLTHTDITGTIVFDSTNTRDPWSGGVINENVIFNNRTGHPAYWLPGMPAALELPDWPANTTAGAMRVFREYLIAMDITQSGVNDSMTFLWSDAAPPGGVPQSWTPGQQSQAGSAAASFTPGGIVDGLTLRDQFMIYKEHAMYALSLIGGVFVMQQRPVFSTLGVLGRNCVTEYRGQHIVLADGDVVLHNGVEAQSIADRVVKKWLFENIDGDNFRNSFLTLDKQESEVWVCVPSKGSEYPDRAAVWSIEDNRWGLRELGINTWSAGSEGPVSAPLAEANWSDKTTTWATDSTLWSESGTSPSRESLMFADVGSKLQVIGEVDTFDGTNPTATLSRAGLAFGDPNKVKFCSRIFPKAQGPAGSVLEVRVGGQLSIDEPVLWGDWAPFTLGTDESVDVYASGRYLAIEFRSTSAAIWRLPAVGFELSEQGIF